MATNGFGSGPYDRGQYDRSWTSDTLIFAASASDIPTAVLFGYETLTFKVSHAAAHVAGGNVFVALGLGVGPGFAATDALVYNASFTLGTDFTYVQTDVVSIEEALTLRTSAGADPSASILIPESLAFKVSQSDAYLVNFNANAILGLGVGSNIIVSSGGITYNALTFGTDFTYGQYAPVSMAESFTLKTSLAADPSASILIPESLVFKTSADYSTSAIALIYQNVSLDSSFVYTPTAKISVNSSIILNSTNFTISTSSTGIFRDVWTSVSVAPPVDTWTSATIGF